MHCGKSRKNITECDRFPGLDTNPGIREYSAAVIRTSPIISVASVQRKQIEMCRLLRTGTHFTVLICTCVYISGHEILIGHCMNMPMLVWKLSFHSFTWTAPLQNYMSHTVQLTVFRRTPHRHAVLTLSMHRNTDYTGRDLFAVT